MSNTMLVGLEEAGLAPKQMIERLDDFVAKVDQLTNIIQLDLAFAQADHIALRINDVELATSAHQAWLEYGEVISQAEINGRPIVVLAFNSPLRSCGWSIECLELPYPAKGKLYPTQDWEHIEFVVPSHAETAEAYLADLRGTYPEFNDQFDKLDDLGVKLKLSSPKGEGERLNNPTVAFKYQGICIKLHPHSLKRIVESELEG